MSRSRKSKAGRSPGSLTARRTCSRLAARRRRGAPRLIAIRSSARTRPSSRSSRRAAPFSPRSSRWSSSPAVAVTATRVRRFKAPAATPGTSSTGPAGPRVARVPQSGPVSCRSRSARRRRARSVRHPPTAASPDFVRPTASSRERGPWRSHGRSTSSDPWRARPKTARRCSRRSLEPMPQTARPAGSDSSRCWPVPRPPRPNEPASRSPMRTSPSMPPPRPGTRSRRAWTSSNASPRTSSARRCRQCPTDRWCKRCTARRGPRSSPSSSKASGSSSSSTRARKPDCAPRSRRRRATTYMPCACERA